VGGDRFCCGNYKTFLICLLIGLLIGGIVLAVVTTMWLTPTSKNS